MCFLMTIVSLVCVPLPSAERCPTLPRLYTSTTLNTVSCCPASSPLKPSCAAPTWSSCKPSSKPPARSRRRVRRPSLTCAGTAPPSTSPPMPRSIGRTSTEVRLWTIFGVSVVASKPLLPDSLMFMVMPDIQRISRSHYALQFCAAV